MKIRAIKATNFKGRTFTTQLADITVLVGDNFTGKSSRTEAMTLALAGYLPGIEKLAGKIYDRYASDSPMSVMVEFDDGRFIGREYTREGDKTTCKVAQRGFNAAWAVEPVVIDSMEFLGLSPKERVKFLVSKLVLSGEVPTPASLFETLAKSDIAKSQPAAELIANMESEIDQDHAQAVTNGLSPQVWLESLGISLNDRRKMVQSRALELSKAHKVSLENKSPMIAYSRSKVENRALEAHAKNQAALEKLNAAKMKQKSATPTSDTRKEEINLNIAERGLKQDIDEQSEAELKLSLVDELENCPTCGAKKAGWKNLIKKKAKEEFEKAQARVKESIQFVKDAGEVLKAKQQMLATLSHSAAEEAHLEVVTATREFNEAQAEEEAAEQEQMDMQRQGDEIKRNEKRKVEAVSVNTEIEVLRELCAIVQGALEKMVNHSILPFVERVNALCGGILPAPIAYQEGELGMAVTATDEDEKPGRFVSWRSFSGSERMLFHAAVSIALAAEAELKLVTLDEVGRLDETRRIQLVTRLHELIADETIGQAVLIEAGYEKWWKEQNVSMIEVK